MNAQNRDKALLNGMADPLLAWYGEHKRSLPWRDDPSPYHVWVSEIMLQQTRVEAVKGYYARFLTELPDIQALAEVPEEKLLKLWEGLGYYNRARNLQKAARKIMDEYAGEMPADYEAILSLPGIGTYTAGAVASIAFGRPVAAVDGNVLRVFARYLADPTDISEEGLKKRRKNEIEQMIPKEYPGIFNQALMDLGAMICLPNGEPKCAECPLRNKCRAHKEGRTAELPVKAPKAERRIEEKTVFVIQYQDKVLIRKRPGKGLLAGLYELPAAPGHLDRKDALVYVEELGFRPLHIEKLPDSRHIFSHLEWRMRGYLVRADELAQKAGVWQQEKSCRLETPESIDVSYPIPSAFAAYAPYIRRKKED
ncbi:MAG: A/G-specific adenine glycosylase [Lachnospiraceae bacterium]|nr:A/G-specific adenine glycosylase [Lachnospiraceae bacterium]